MLTLTSVTGACALLLNRITRLANRPLIEN